MSDFAERIKKARLLASLSQEALADAISQLFDKKKISRTAITQWESSKTTGIEAANLLKAAKILDVNPDWLQFGYGHMRPTDLSRITISSRRIPLLNNKQAANPQEQYKEILSEVGLDESLVKITGPDTFALRIHDNSMAPTFISDDLVVIDPAIQPCPGEYVVAKLLQEEGVVFRKYKPSSHFYADPFELIALNEDWRGVIVTEKNSKIVGTLVEHRCKRRVDP